MDLSLKIKNAKNAFFFCIFASNHIHTETEEIVCTPNHSVLTIDGWKEVKELTNKDLIKTSIGYVKVLSIKLEQLQDSQKVYNFNVLGYHTYVVGNNLLVVHNECHHTVSNKGKRGKAMTEKINNHFGGNIDINGNWNLTEIPSHRGRHTNSYHDMVDNVINNIINQGITSPEEFKCKMSIFKVAIKANPECMGRNGSLAINKIYKSLSIIIR